LTNSPYIDTEASWSPGGTRLVFTRYATDPNDGDLWLINADGTGLRQLTAGSADDFQATWSPDGSRIAFGSDRDGDYDIYTMDPTGHDIRRVTTNTGIVDYEPAWSPDGTQIAFISNRATQDELYVMAASGGPASIIHAQTGSGFDIAPAWSPDGGTIAFTEGTVDQQGNVSRVIATVSATGGEDRVLAAGSGPISELPAYSPDGTTISFDSDRLDDNYLEPPDYVDVFTVPSDFSFSTEPTLLSGGVALTNNYYIDPDWQPMPTFPLVDARFSAFSTDIVWLYGSEITKGCDAERFCPKDAVTRGQMAAFLVRGLKLAGTTTDYFTDDDGTLFESDINRLAASGITTGCTATTFCPTKNVTRGQMAAFLVRALHLPTTSTDYFTDDDGTLFENDINRLAASGITKGCTATTFCPSSAVTREQMAAFLHRALG
jgi:dipeptidyl aminopeptidase/acylaminoacyl peptidase